METKPWWASKTIWTNVVGGLAAVGTVFGLEIADPETQATLVAGVLAVANIILRFVTDRPVGK